jgi:hypothetical protein
VESYEVRSIDGEKPAVGTLAGTPAAVLLVGRDTVELTAVPEGLRGKNGAKVWVVGHRVGKSLEVQSFGIIRDASR